MVPFWYPFGTRWLTLGVSRNRSKNVPQKCGTWCQKGAQMESLSEPNRGQIQGKNGTLFLTLPGTLLGSILDPCWYLFCSYFGIFFDDFWPRFLYIFSWCARSVFQTLRHILSRTWPRSRRRRGRKPHGMHRKVLCSCGFCWELFLTCSLSLRASRSPVRKGLCFKGFFEGPSFGGQRVAQELPKGVVLRHFFTLLGCLVGYLFLASIFDSF